jgi:hypothetical protein
MQTEFATTAVGFANLWQHLVPYDLLRLRVCVLNESSCGERFHLTLFLLRGWDGLNSSCAYLDPKHQVRNRR